MSSMGVRSTYLQQRLPLAPNGIFIADKKLEAIVNDISRLSMNATIIEPNPIFRGYAIEEAKIIPDICVLDEPMPFTPEWQYLPKKFFDFASIGVMIFDFNGSSIVGEYSMFYQGILDALKPKSIVQLKISDFHQLELKIFERVLRSNNINNVMTMFNLEHQNSKLFMFEINKEVK